MIAFIGIFTIAVIFNVAYSLGRIDQDKRNKDNEEELINE